MNIIRPLSRGYMFSPYHNVVVSGDERAHLIDEWEKLPSKRKAA